MIFSAPYFVIVSFLYLYFNEAGKTLGEAGAGWQIAFTFGIFMPLIVIYIDDFISSRTKVCKKCEHFYYTKNGDKCCGIGAVYRFETPLKEEKSNCIYFTKKRRDYDTRRGN